MMQVVIDGVLWASTSAACQQLGVKPHNLADWVRRSKQAGHRAGSDCPACVSPSAFPHVDPPRMAGRRAAYQLEQLFEAERQTRPARHTHGVA